MLVAQAQLEDVSVISKDTAFDVLRCDESGESRFFGNALYIYVAVPLLLPTATPQERFNMRVVLEPVYR